MTTRQDPFAVDLGDVHSPTHWPSLLPDDAPQAWADLRDWVEALVDRFALETRVVPPCWYRHNALVEGLSALRDHERISFAPNASPTAAVDWVRALREIEHRLTEVCARTQCSVNEHRSNPLRTWLTDQDQWRTFVEADVHDREQQVIGEDLIGGAWHSPGTPPGPSPLEDRQTDTSSGAVHWRQETATHPLSAGARVR